MRAKNNSNPAICVNNLLQIARGEVPYERIKGVAAAQIDSPASEACDDMSEDASWMVEAYEPRAQVDSIKVDTDGPLGNFRFTANIKTKEAGE